MKRWLPPAVLTVLFVLFRVPALLNPGLINSDGAIAGLQASRMLEGEWQWLHWQRDYLTSLDSVMVLPFFLLFGATPLVLMSVTLLGQLTSAWLGYSIAERRIGPWPALVVTLPLVFMTMGLNIYLFFNIRQWCVALVMLACWLIDRSAEAARPRLLLVLGILVAFLALFVDLYASQFIPGVLLFAVLSALDGSWKLRPLPPRFWSIVGGVVLGVVLLVILRRVADVHTGRSHLNTNLIPRNLPLLVEQCFPWLIGAKVFAMGEGGAVNWMASPWWLVVVQVIGTVVCLGGLVSGSALFFVKRIPWRVRVLGAVGSGMAFTSIFGFLCSSTAVDIMGARLLLPVVISLPLTLAPLAFFMGTTPRLSLLLAPYLLTAAIGGWLSYGVMIDGPLPRRTVQGAMTHEHELGEFLRSKDVRYAAAEYWVAYRLSFILGENPIVVPEASEDRYPRWREQFDAASRVAYVLHPSSPGLTSEAIEQQLNERKLTFEKAQVQGYTVLLVQQKAP